LSHGTSCTHSPPLVLLHLQHAGSTCINCFCHFQRLCFSSSNPLDIIVAPGPALKRPSLCRKATMLDLLKTRRRQVAATGDLQTLLSGVEQRCLCRKPTLLSGVGHLAHAENQQSTGQPPRTHSPHATHCRELQTMAAAIEPFVCLIDLPVSFQLACFCLCKSIKDRFEELPN
jgi:hypothetical protein